MKIKKLLPYKYFWISIEGTDAAGKTSLLNEIEIFLKKQKGMSFSILPEFSNSKIGNQITAIIKKKRFFCLGDTRHYPFAETLLLAADFIYQFEEVLSRYPKKHKLLIISDRGPYSFLTYQYLRIKQHSSCDLGNLKNWLNNIFLPIGFPNFVFLLISPIKDIKKRIEKGEGVILKKKDLLFIQRVQEEYLKVLKETPYSSYLILENQNGNFNLVKEKAIEVITKMTKQF